MLLLEGIRVIDWTIWQQGPVATAMLADMGAEVIKVEQPLVGDPSRGARRQLGISLELKGGRTALFEHHNRNKKGIAIDLAKEQGRQILHDLIEKSDVFVHNWRPDVARRLGLSYDVLKARNSRLIYASASGYGPKGPDSNQPSLDPMGQARSGIMWNVGEPSVFPQSLVPGIVDQVGAMLLSYGIIAALLGRERLGIGQEVSTSLLGSGISMQGMSIAIRMLAGKEYQRHARRRAPNPLYNYYQCKDGEWISLALLQSDRFWPDFCKALGVAGLENDPLFSSAERREENSEALVTLLDGAFKARTYAEWESTLKGVCRDFIYTRIANYGDLASDPQALANEYIVDFEHPTLGKIKMPGFPVTFGKTPAGLRTPAPELGQDTEEVLTSICRYSWEDITQLKESGVIP